MVLGLGNKKKKNQKLYSLLVTEEKYVEIMGSPSQCKPTQLTLFGFCYFCSIHDEGDDG